MARKAKPGNPMVAVAYLRVSTEDQHLGPEAQRASIELWAKRTGSGVVSWHEDHGVSGGAPLERRPALLECMDGIRAAGAGVLIVAKRDRLARDVVAAAMIEQLTARIGARIVSAAGEGTDGDENDPNGKLMRGLIDLFAQHEREIIRARTKAALAVKKSRNQRVGSIPFGKRLGEDGVLVESESEAWVIFKVVDLHRSGLSQRQIVAWLRQNSITGRTGYLNQTQVCRILSQHVRED